MPGSKITLPSSRCIVLLLLLLLVGFIPPEETHNVTPFSFTDEWKNAMLSLGVDSEQFPTTNDKLPPPPPVCVCVCVCGKIVSLIKKNASFDCEGGDILNICILSFSLSP